jgi:putative endonuclease
VDKFWFVYIVECKDKKLYTGITNDIKRRIKQHNCGQGCRFTKYRNPVKLIHKEMHETKAEALKKEAAIKKLTRSKKLKLIGLAG